MKHERWYFIHTIEIKDNQNGLATNITQNIFFSVPLKKDTHAGLDRHEGEQMKTEFSFLVELSL